MKRHRLDSEDPRIYKRTKLDEDDYFNDDGPDTNTSTSNAGAAAEDGDEVDPLDAFMADLHATMAKTQNQASTGPKIRRDDIEEEDPIESFIKHRNKQRIEEERRSGQLAGEPQDIEYDSDDNPIIKKRQIDVLPPLDHSKIKYEEFEKNFYDEHEEIANMTENEVIQYRKALDIRVSGNDPIRPVKTFAQMGFEKPLLDLIAQEGYTEPTPIQKQAVPIALSGRDLIGIAKTGSGKTAAFVWPMIVHIIDQREVEKGEGPIAIIAAPTRELAAQIYIEAKKFCRAYGIRVCSIIGGVGKGEQIMQLRSQPFEVIVCTPGRLIDMIKAKAVKMNRVTFLVLDEADRMFDLGFEPQVRSIVGQIRPDRQTLLFSATFKPAVEQLARDILTDPIKITVGQAGAANEDITQVVEVVENDDVKWRWLAQRIQNFVNEGSVLIFGSTKASTEEITAKLNAAGYKAAAIHGDKDMNERIKIMHAYKSGVINILVATDVAARGLDVKSVKTVVNYHVARDIDSHTHRIGRTGRAGEKGVAYTLITPKESHFAALLVKNLESANQLVPDALLEIAMKDLKFKKARGRRTRGLGSGKGRSGYRTGIGYSGTPNVSSTPSPASSTPRVATLPGGRPFKMMTFVSAKDTSDALSSSSYKSTTTSSTSDTYNPEQPTDEYDPTNPTSTDTPTQTSQPRRRWDQPRTQ